MKNTRRQFTDQEKVKILRLHLLERKPVSDICDDYVSSFLYVAPSTAIESIPKFCYFYKALISKVL